MEPTNFVSQAQTEYDALSNREDELKAELKSITQKKRPLRLILQSNGMMAKKTAATGAKRKK